MLAMPNLNPRKLTVQSRSVSGNMDDIKVTAVLVGSIIPLTLARGSLMVLVLVDIVSPVYLCAVCCVQPRYTLFMYTDCTVCYL